MHTAERWDVWTDGSAVCDESIRRPGMPGENGRYPGGWAAVIEHGSDGYVLRGREAGTTNVRMELRAAIEGLKAVPIYDKATLHFDCTAILSVYDVWVRGLTVGSKRDRKLWVELAAQFDRVDVKLHLITRGGHPIHRRAHVIAGAEAKALAAGLPWNAEPLELKSDRKQARKHSAIERARMKDAFAAVGLRHEPECREGFCVTKCAVWRYYGYIVA